MRACSNLKRKGPSLETKIGIMQGEIKGLTVSRKDKGLWRIPNNRMKIRRRRKKVENNSKIKKTRMIAIVISDLILLSTKDSHDFDYHHY